MTRSEILPRPENMNQNQNILSETEQKIFKYLLPKLFYPKELELKRTDPNRSRPEKTDRPDKNNHPT